jgi:hypothetical protein
MTGHKRRGAARYESGIPNADPSMDKTREDKVYPDARRNWNYYFI